MKTRTIHTDRGDLRSYFMSVAVLTVSISLLLLLYRSLDPVFLNIWGERSAWYIDTYRTWGAKVWRLLYRCTSSWLFLWLPVLWLLATFLFQFALIRSKARVFNRAHIAFILILAGIASFSFFGLILMPLITKIS